MTCSELRFRSCSCGRPYLFSGRLADEEPAHVLLVAGHGPPRDVVRLAALLHDGAVVSAQVGDGDVEVPEVWLGVGVLAAAAAATAAAVLVLTKGQQWIWNQMETISQPLVGFCSG